MFKSLTPILLLAAAIIFGVNTAARAGDVVALPYPESAGLQNAMIQLANVAIDLNTQARTFKVVRAQSPSRARLVNSALRKDGLSNALSLAPANSAEQIEAVLNNTATSDNLDVADRKALLEALTGASRSGLILLVGTGAHRGLVAFVAAVFDPSTQEFFYLIDRTVGVDD